MALLRSDRDRYGDGHKDRDEGKDAELSQRQPGTGCDTSRDIHREPPSWEGPRRALPRTDGGGKDLVSIHGRWPQVEVLEDLGQMAFEASIDGHATCPPRTCSGAGAGSAVTVTRIAASA